MRDFLGRVNAVQLQTQLGAIFLTPGSKLRVQVNAPRVTVDGMPLQAPALFASGGKSCNFSSLRHYKPQAGIRSTAGNGIQARLVDSRVAVVVILDNE